MKKRIKVPSSWNFEYGKPELLIKPRKLAKPECVVVVIAWLNERNFEQQEYRFYAAIKSSWFSKKFKNTAVIFVTNKPEVFQRKINELSHFNEVWILKSTHDDPNSRRKCGLKFSHKKYGSVPIILCDGRRTLTKTSNWRRILSQINDFSPDGMEIGYFRHSCGFAKYDESCATQVVAFRPPSRKKIWDIPECFSPGKLLEDFFAIIKAVEIGAKLTSIKGCKTHVRSCKENKIESILRNQMGFKCCDYDKHNIKYLLKKGYLSKGSYDSNDRYNLLLTITKKSKVTMRKYSRYWKGQVKTIENLINYDKNFENLCLKRL